MTCECGCGEPTALAKETDSRWGHTKGKPVRFVRGHHARVNHPLWNADVALKVSQALAGKPKPWLRGSNNPQWRGGEAKHRNDGRLRWDHRLWRQAVVARDKVCQDCGSAEQLHAHHIFPYATYPHLRYEVNNGITLCHDCHWRVERCLRINERGC
jgi:hypothetical protein